jgi:hypothetical protein
MLLQFKSALLVLDVWNLRRQDETRVDSGKRNSTMKCVEEVCCCKLRRVEDRLNQCYSSVIRLYLSPFLFLYIFKGMVDLKSRTCNA